MFYTGTWEEQNFYIYYRNVHVSSSIIFLNRDNDRKGWKDKEKQHTQGTYKKR